MTERINRADLDEAADNLNRRLEAAGSSYRVAVEGRYDYTAVDEMRKTEGGGWAPWGNAIVAGTKRECYEAVLYMMRGIDYATEYDGRYLEAIASRKAPEVEGADLRDLR